MYRKHTWRRLYPALSTSLLFAGSYVAAKYATKDIAPLLVTLIRHTVAGLFLQLLVWQQRRHRPPLEALDKASLINWVCFFLIGTFGIVGHHFLFLSSLCHTAMTNSAIISAFTPVLTGTLSAIFLKERLTFRNYTGGMIAFTGIVLLLTEGDFSNLRQFKFNQGEILMVGAVTCWSLYSILLKYLSRFYNNLTISYCGLWLGIAQLLLLLPLVLMNPSELSVSLLAVSKPAIFGVVYMGVMASGMGYLLFSMSVNEIGPTKSNSLIYSSLPLWVALLAWVVFSEPITGCMVVSMSLVMVGLYCLFQPVSLWNKGRRDGVV